MHKTALAPNNGQETCFGRTAGVALSVPLMAIRDSGQALDDFPEKRANCPVLRKKGSDDHFTLTADVFEVDGKRMGISFIGWIPMRETFRSEETILSTTISRTAGERNVSIAVEASGPDLPKSATLNWYNTKQHGLGKNFSACKQIQVL